jgi:hypothetical protein
VIQDDVTIGHGAIVHDVRDGIIDRHKRDLLGRTKIVANASS